MGITEFSLNTSRVTILFIVFVIVSGIVLFLDYPKQEDPSIIIREAVVTASFPGMSTERVENLITQRLEEKIREIPEVDDIKSDSKTGISIVHVVLKDQVKDLAPIWQDLRNKMDDVKTALPQGTLGPVVNDEFGLTAVATIALWADGFSLAEMREVARSTRDRLYSVAGIKKVELYGIQNEQVYLELSNTKMAQFGISPGVVMATLQKQNIILPGGKIDADGQEIIIEPSGNFNDVAEIESAFAKRSAKDVGAAAHKLKSSARAVGAHRLADLCLALEKAGKSEEWVKIEASAPDIQGVLGEIIEYIESL